MQHYHQSSTLHQQQQVCCQLSPQEDLSTHIKHPSYSEIRKKHQNEDHLSLHTSSNVQSHLQKSSYSFLICSIEDCLSAAFRARPSTTLAASSSVIPLNTSIGT